MSGTVTQHETQSVTSQGDSSSPMLEVLQYLRANAYRTYIVTGGGQDFVRVYSQQVYGIPPEQVVGTAEGTKYGYGKDGRPFLTKERARPRAFT